MVERHSSLSSLATAGQQIVGQQPDQQSRMGGSVTRTGLKPTVPKRQQASAARPSPALPRPPVSAARKSTMARPPSRPTANQARVPSAAASKKQSVPVRTTSRLSSGKPSGAQAATASASQAPKGVPVRKPRPPGLQMMPSMRAKHDRNLRKKQCKGNWLPRGLIVEIALTYSKKLKEAMLLISLDRKFRDCLRDTPRFWYLICLHEFPKLTFNFITKHLGSPINVHKWSIRNVKELQSVGDELPRHSQQLNSFSWRDVTKELLKQRDGVTAGKLLAEFKRAVQSSVRGQLQTKQIIQKHKTQFQVQINGGKKHNFLAKKLLMSQQSLNFDLVVQDSSLTFDTLRSLRVKAFMMELKLVKIVIDWNLPKRVEEFEEIQNLSLSGDIRLFKIGVGHGSSLIVGTFNDAETICFLSFHVMHLDTLMQVTGLERVIHESSCDIDLEFGLHDYTVSFELHNSNETFFDETFRSVFTRTVDRKWATFPLIQSEERSRYYRAPVRQRFTQMFYQWASMIFSEKVSNLVILDLHILDEFGQPFFFSCSPVEVETKQRLFENEHNFAMQQVVSGEGPLRMVCIRFESKLSADQPMMVDLDLQFMIDLDEGTMAITNAELRISSDSIRNHFKGSLTPQYFQRQSKLQNDMSRAF